MKSITSFLFLILLQAVSLGQNTKIANDQFREDFQFFLNIINEEYCYFDKTLTNMQKVQDIYSPMVDTVKSREAFVSILEKVFYEIYDHHAVLNTNNNNSRRLVPSGTDIWAEYINGKPIITELKRGFGAQASGVLAGMEVIAVNDIPVQSAIAAFLPKSVNAVTNEAKCFSLRLVLAGDHVQPRKFTLKYNGLVKDYFPDQQGFLLDNFRYTSKIESKIIDNTGYIKINDCLYDNDLIAAFDSVMQTLTSTKAIILDFRETPSGGNASVAKAIIGWFTNKEHFYQKHEYYAEEKSSGIKRSWVEIVSPRKGKYYAKPLALLCNHWTGSIGEGIIIGFDALNRPNTKIIGTEMAHLKGAVYSFEMPHTRVRFTFPTERLYHVNGTARELYTPDILVDCRKTGAKAQSDEFLTTALQYLKTRN